MKGKRRTKAGVASLVLVVSMVFGLFAPAVQAISPELQSADYMNASLSVEERVADLLGRMTLDEKLGQMVQASRVGNSGTLPASEVTGYFLGSVLSGGGANPSPNTPAAWADMHDSYQNAALVTRLGIPILYGVDAVHGHNNVYGATIFPHNIGLGAAGLGLHASSGDWTSARAMMNAIGSATAQEVRATGIEWTFAPTLAIPQDIRWGRTYEGYGQSSELVGKLGAAMVEGLQGISGQAGFMQGEKVVSTIKHWVGDGATTGGIDQGNAAMTEEELRVYMAPYIEAIEAGARTVMVTLSSWNGLKTHADHRLVTEILKDEFGFDGIVVSDWNAVGNTQNYHNWTYKEAVKQTVNAGVDMFMLQDWKPFITTVKELIAENAIEMTRIDDAVSRILRVKFESGLFEHPLADRTLLASHAVGSAANRAVAKDAVSKSLVLLKNEVVNEQGDRALPLDKHAKILVAGTHADNIGLQMGGWSISWQGSEGETTVGTTILDGMKKVAPEAEIVYQREAFDYDPKSFDAVLVVVGEQPYAEMNGDNLNGLALSRDQQLTVQRAKESGVPTIVVMLSGRPMIISEQVSDLDAVVAAWLPGTEGDGVAEVLFGNQDFTGKLPMDWPWYAEQLPMSPDHRAGNTPLFAYGAGGSYADPTSLPVIGPKPPKPEPAYVAIPAAGSTKIQAEHFTARAGVQNENTSDEGGGQNVGYLDAGNWMEYRFDVEAAGLYDVQLRVAGNGNPQPTGNIRMQSEMDGGTKTVVADVPFTGGWQNWTTITSQVFLKAGKQTFRITSGAGGWNLNWFAFAYNRAATPEELQPDAAATPVELPPLQPNAVKVWYSSEKDPSDFTWYMNPAGKEAGITYKLAPQQRLPLTGVGGDAITTFNLNADMQYQTFLGLGTSMEEATVANLREMSPAVRDEILSKLVGSGESEAGMSLIRMTFGTSDFTGQPFYSYDDMPAGETDPMLEHFSIQKDIDLGIADALKGMLAVNPNLKIFATPWSPPGWMKSSGSMVRGQLKEEYIPVAAQYYRKALEAYANEGVPIYAMTLQNEPELEIDYPSMSMSPDQQRRFAIALRAALDESPIESVRNTKLWAFDHNFSGAMSYMGPIFADPAAKEALDGVAFHDYSGSPTEMTSMHNAYPDKEVLMSERSVWGTSGADRIAQYLRNYSIGYNAWVTMLDTAVMPEQWVGIPDPTMLMQNAQNPDEYWALPEFYLTAQFSKFIQPGAKRIESNYGSSSTVTNVAFLNPDNTIAMVVINQTSQDQWFKAVADGKQFQAKLPAKTVATYVWERSAEPTVLPATVQAEDFIAKAEGMNSVTAADGTTIYMGGNETGRWLEYEAEVPTGGQYQVQYRMATDAANWGGWHNKQFSLYSVNPADSSDKLLLGRQNLTPPSTWGWENWALVQDTVQLSAGVHKLRLEIDAGPFNLDWIRFSPAPAPDSVPGKINAADFEQSNIALIESGGNTGSTATGTWLDYKVNVAEAGNYPITLRYATNEAGASAVISSDDESPAEVTIPLASTGGWNNYVTFTSSEALHLEPGEQTIRIAVNVGFNLQWLSIGTGLLAETSTIHEGQEDGQVIALSPIGTVFGESGLEVLSVGLENAPRGVSVTDSVYATSESLATATLVGNRSEDYDENRTPTVTMTVYDHGSGSQYVLRDRLIFQAENDPETLSAAWNADYSQVLLTLTGGSFNPDRLNEISFSEAGTTVHAVQTGIALTGDGTTQALISLAWNGAASLREDLSFAITVPTIAYEDSKSGTALTAHLMREADSGSAPYQQVPGRIEAESYARTAGTAITSAGAEGSVIVLESADWAEYKLDVPASGDYVFSYRLTSDGGAAQGLRSSIDGTMLQTRNVIQLYNNWVVYKDIVHLEAGQHVYKIENAGTGTYRLNWFEISPIPGPSSIPGIIEAEQTHLLTGGVAQDGDGGAKHLGFLNAGNVLTYPVNISQSGPYHMEYRVATAQSAAQFELRIDNTVLFTAPIESTGGWSNWVTLSKDIELPVGEHTLEVRVVGDGFNFDWMSFAFAGVTDTTAPVTTAAVTSGTIGNNGWYTSDVAVSLTAADDASGVASTEYRLNGGAWTPYSADGILLLSADGEYTIEYRSTDVAGNVEVAKLLTLKIDQTGPLLNVVLNKTVMKPPYHKMNPIHVKLTYSDALSGMSKVKLVSVTSNQPAKKGKQEFELLDAEFGTEDTQFMIVTKSAGKEVVYTITYEATDKAGNVTTVSGTITVPKD